jgi:hypothetical protein
MISIAREARGRDSSNEPFAQQLMTVPFSSPSLRLRDPIAVASERERAGAIKASKDTKTSAEKFDVGQKKKKKRRARFDLFGKALAPALVFRRFAAVPATL